MTTAVIGTGGIGWVVARGSPQAAKPCDSRAPVKSRDRWGLSASPPASVQRYCRPRHLRNQRDNEPRCTQG